MTEYRPKSSLDMMREQKEEPIEDVRKVEQIVTAPVKTKKKSVWSKIKEEFISEDGKTVGDYILLDVLIPAAKKTISDSVTNAVDMVLYGGRAPKRNDIPGSRVSYRTYYESNQRNSYYSTPRVSSVSDYSYDEIIFQNRGDADAVLNELHDIIHRYGLAKVADFKDLAGVNGSFTDNKYGWTDLRYASIKRERNGGYFIDLPRPMPID